MSCLFNTSPVLFAEEILLDSENICDSNLWHSSIKITDETFNGFKDPDTGERIHGLEPYQLKSLTSTTHIHGNLTITASFPKQLNLNFFKNVKSIDTLFISNTSLTYLGLISLKPIRNIVVEHNHNLCVNSSESFWRKMMPGKEGIFKVSNNKPEEECGSCDEECDQNFGCWGPGPGYCKKCRNVFDTRSRQCVESCAGDQYVNQGVCADCHQDCCPQGCSGPHNNGGPEGCNPCPKPLVRFWRKFSFHHLRTFCVQILDCLQLNSSCPDGTFEDQPFPSGQGRFKKIAGKQVCTSCHPYCLKCTGHGFNKDVCQECSYKDCSCPAGFYFDTCWDECVACDHGCKTCADSGRCLECDHHHVFRVYPGGVPEKDVRFRCVHKCPHHQPFPFNDKLYQNYCSTVNLEDLKSTPDPIHNWMKDVSLFLIIALGLIFLFAYTLYARQMSKIYNAYKYQKVVDKLFY